MLSLNKSVLSLATCFTFAVGFAIVAQDAFASERDPKCRDVASATRAVNSVTALIERNKTKLEQKKAWMNAATAICSNAPATPTPSVSCRTTQQPKAPIWENGVCMKYTETFFTCEKDFNSFRLGGAEETFRGKTGDNKWQINYRAPSNFPPCPAR
jgi:hypothetical protein